MPRKTVGVLPGVRRYGTKSNYTTENLQEALEKIRSGRLSQREAAKMFYIPRSTLKNKLKGKHTKEVGRPTALTRDEEVIIANHITAVSEQGIPVTLYDLRCIIKSYLDNIQHKVPIFKDNKPGWEWGKLFLSRHPIIKQTFAANISRKRAQVGEVEINKFFENIEQELVDVPPENIFNFDESGFHDQPKKNKVLFRRSCRHPEIIRNSTKSCFTVMFCGSAVGELVPPYLIFKGKHKWTDWMYKAPPGSRMNVSKSGWIETEIFDDWFENQLLPILKNKEGKKVVIGDNLSSHVSIKTLQLCEQHNIKFLCLVPNSTHLLQPLDVAFFSPLKTAWRSVLLQWRMTAQGKKCISLPNNRFAQLLTDTLTQVHSRISENLIAGFKATDICPLSRERVISKLPDYTKRAGLNNIENAVGAEFQQYLETIRISDLSAPQRQRKYQLPALPGKSVSAEEVEAFYRNKDAKKTGKGKRKKQTPLDKKNQAKKRNVAQKRKYVSSSDDELDIDMESNTSNIDDENSILTEIELENRSTLEISERRGYNKDTCLEEQNLENETDVTSNIDNQINEIAREKEEEGEVNNIIQNINEMPIIFQSLSSTSEEYIVVGPELHEVLQSAASKETKYQTNDYVVVHYNNQYFPGIVTEIIENENNGFTYLVNAMERIGKKWQWPKRKDEILYEEEDVIKKINNDDIKPHTNRGLFNVKDQFIQEKWASDKKISKPRETKYQENDYVVVHYEKNFFPGVITEVQIEENDKFIYKVNALERFGNKWKWPGKKDEIFYKEEDVIKSIKDSDIIPYSNRAIFIINDSFLADKWDG